MVAIIDGIAFITNHPLRTRAIVGRVDAACHFHLAQLGDSDARSVAELRVRRWPGYMNRHYRKRAKASRQYILFAMSVRW